MSSVDAIKILISQNSFIPSIHKHPSCSCPNKKKVPNIDSFRRNLYTNQNLLLWESNSEIGNPIYLYTPFNSKSIYNAPVSSISNTHFKDMWKCQEINDTNLEISIEKYQEFIRAARFIRSANYLQSKAVIVYITYLTHNIAQPHYTLESTNSLYLYLNYTVSNYPEVIINEILDKTNFKKEIVWEYSIKVVSKRHCPRKDNIILFYKKSGTKSGWYFFNIQTNIQKEHTKNINRFSPQNDNPMYYKKGSNNYCLHDGFSVKDVCNIYPFQNQYQQRRECSMHKQLALLESIIKSTSKEGNLMLEPFCRYSTAYDMKQKLNRNWVSIDIEKNAIEIPPKRIQNIIRNIEEETFKTTTSNFIYTTSIQKRTDIKEESKKYIRRGLFGTHATREYKFGECKQDVSIINLEIDHIIKKSKCYGKCSGNYYKNHQPICINSNRMEVDKPITHSVIKLKELEKTTQYKFNLVDKDYE